MVTVLMAVVMVSVVMTVPMAVVVTVVVLMAVVMVSVVMAATVVGGRTHLVGFEQSDTCLLYTSPSPRDMRRSRMPSSA